MIQALIATLKTLENELDYQRVPTGYHLRAEHSGGYARAKAAWTYSQGCGANQVQWRVVCSLVHRHAIEWTKVAPDRTVSRVNDVWAAVDTLREWAAVGYHECGGDAEDQSLCTEAEK